MRQFLPPGSVRGRPGNWPSYRDGAESMTPCFYEERADRRWLITRPRLRKRRWSTMRRLFLLLAFVLISGCTDQSQTTIPNDVSAQLVESGFRDPVEVKEVLAFLKDAAEQKNFAAISERVHFPITLYDDGKSVQVFADAAEVLMEPRTVFSDRVLLTLKQARYADLFVRDQGAMIGDGEVWLSQYPQGVMIKAINP